MGLRWFLVLIILAITVHTATAQACQINTPQGYLLDTDCDGWDDALDNCPYDPNGAQFDENQNGAGDACDYIATAVDFSPSTITEPGDIITLHLNLINSRPRTVENIQVNIQSQDLNVNTQSTLESLFSGEYHTFDFLLKVPSCINKNQARITITLDYQDQDQILSQSLFEDITVQDGECDKEETALDNTRLDTIIFQEVLAGESAIYPLTLTNANPTAQTYTISIEGLEHASYRLDPTSQITVPSGSQETIYLYIDTEASIPAGNRKIMITIETPQAKDHADVGLRILKDVGQNDTQHAIKTALEIALIILVVVLIIGGIILAMKKANEGS